jgi:general secretion pathway protein L
VPTVLIPDVLAVPMPAEGWGILFSNQLALVRTDWQAGFAIEVDNLVKALQLVTSPPQQLVIYNHSPALSQLATLGIPITVVMEEDSEEVVLDWLVQGGLAKHPLNLLQGDYRRQDKWINVWRQWRLTVILLIIFGGLYLANQYSEYRQLVEQYEILTKQLEQVYRDTFPEARKVVNPRVQMEQQLKTLRAANVPTSPIRNIFQLLDKISIPLARTPGFTLKQLDYQAGRLDLQLEVANFQSLEYLKKRLTNLGVTVEILSAVNRNEIVVSRVRISET